MPLLAVPKMKCLPPIPGGVIADREPEVAGAPQAEAHRHAVDEDHDDAKPVFAGIAEMCGGKQREKIIAEVQKLQLPGSRRRPSVVTRST